MCTKAHVKLVLHNKFQHFLRTIKDEDLRKAVEDGTIVTGGAISSLLLNEDVNDFDLYFNSAELTARVAKYFLMRFLEKNKIDGKYEVKQEDGRVRIMIKSAGVAGTREGESNPNYEYFEQYSGDADATRAVEYLTSLSVKKSKEDVGKYDPIFITENAITLTDKIQLILRFAGSPEEVHKNFDFVHCTCWWQSWDEKLVLPEAALLSLLTKELKYTGSLFPVCSLFRLRKFIARGFTINAGQILKISMQISNINFNDPMVLEEQLIGVDVAYMNELIMKLRKSQDEGTEIDHTYITSLLDEIFE